MSFRLPLWENRDNGNANGTGTGYTHLSMPKVSISEYYTLNCYDDYNFYGNLFGQSVGVGQVTGHRTRTLLTGTKSKVLGTATMLLTVNYYDEQGQVLQSKMENHLAGTDVLSNTWSFSAELVTSTRVHTVGGTTTNISNRYEYDHMGRKLNSRESINGQTEVMLSKLEYNEIGQLLNKKLHSINNGVNFLESTDFAYNERGWLKNSTSNQFSLWLEYQDGTSPQFNGNISNQLWGSTAALTNAFTYSYDK